MENMFKRFLSLALAVLMVVSMMPTTAFATETQTGEEPVTSVADDTSTVEVSTYEALLAALETENAKIKLMDNITASATQSSGYGKAGIVLEAGDVLDGNGKKLTINDANATWDCAIAMKGGEVKNLTIAGAMRGVFMPGANGDVVIDTCVFEDVIYTFNSDAGSKDYTVTIKNTTLNGWTSFSDAHKSVAFEDCVFGEGNGYAFCRPYQATTFTGCSFAEGYEFDTSEAADDSFAFENCTYADNALSDSNSAMFYNGGSVVINGAATDVTQYAVKIGTTGYATLAEAVAEAQSGDTIELLEDAELSGALILPSGKTLTINGNGHKLTPAEGFVGGGHNAAIVLGGNDAAYKEDNNYTIEGLTFEGFNGLTRVVRANFSNAVIEDCVFNGNSVSEGVITSAYAKLLVKDCKFTGNISGFAVVNVGSDVSTATELSADITGSTFTENQAAIAVVYLATSANVTGNEFKQNMHTGDNANGAAVLAGPYVKDASFTINITENAFVEAMGEKPAVFAEDWNAPPYGTITAFDLSANYWDGAKPVAGTAYQTSGTNPNVKLDNYYTDEALTNLVNLNSQGLSGEGTEASPFLIEDIDDLKFFRDQVNGGTTYDNQFIKLNADINLNNEAWTPIGNSTNKFLGTFDGGNFTISNLVVNGGANAGFFGFADGCAIKNLKINNAAVIGTDCVGGIAGQVYSTSTIDNCHVSGLIKIEGQTNVGGIVGKYYVKVSNSSVIGNGVENSYVKGTYDKADLEGDNVGGIMGHGGESNNFVGNTVKNITVIGTRKVGGIVGTTNRATNVTGCTVENVVIATNATAEYAAGNSSSMDLGGLIGHYYNSGSNGNLSESTISNVTFETNGIADAGAIIGGDRATPNAAPVGVTASNITVSNINGATHKYLEPVVYVAEVGNQKFETLEEAFKAATDGCIIEILADVTVDGKWDCRDYATNGSHSQFKESVTINGNGHTIKFTGTVSDGNWNTIFRFEENATVNNLTVDISEATGAQRVISAKKSLNVDGLTIVGSAKYGIIFGEGASAADLAAAEIVIKNSTLTGTRRAISDNEGGKDVKSAVITGNALKANAYVSASASIVFNNNTTEGEVDLRSYAAENVLSVEAQGNTLTDGVKNYIYAKTINAQPEFNTQKPAFKVSTKDELNAALAAAQDGDTIEILAEEITFAENAASIVIKKAVTIKGNGAENTKLVFNSATSAFVIQSSNVTFEGMTIAQGTKDNSFGISISKGASNAPAIQYSDITIQNVDFVGGDYALCLIGEDVVVDSCTFTNQDSHNIIIYSLKGNSEIKNNTFGKSKGNNKSAILFEGGADNATDLSGFIGGGTLTISGNTANNKGTFFQFTNWKLVKDMNVKIIENEINAFTNKAIALYDMDGAIKANGDEFASFVVTKNAFTDVPAGRPILKEYTGTVTVDASANYLGSAEPDCEALLAGDQVTVDSYYKDEARTNLVSLKAVRIGEQYYASLAEALAVVKNGETVTILENIALTETVTVPAGKTVTLDLNNKTISGTHGSEYSMIHVLNGATLTVEGEGKIAYAAGGNKTGAAIWVEGALVQNGGTIELTGSWTLGFAVDLRPNAWGTAHTAPASFTMNGGKISSSDTAVRVASNSSDAYEELGVTFTMNGGTIESDWDAIFVQHLYAGDLDVLVKDGKISGTNSALRIYGEAGSDVDMDIQNGTFTGEIKVADAYADVNPISITGGTFSVDPSAYAADGYKAVKNTDDTYGVVKANYVAKVNGTKYESLQAAIDVADGNTVTILENIALTETVTVPAGKAVTLDLNNKTISGTHGSEYSMIHVLNGATLTVEGEGKITYAAGGNNTGAAIWVEGALVQNGGTIELTGSWNLGFAVDLRPNAWGTAHTVPATFVMNSGKISSSDTAVRVASNSSDAYEEQGVTFTMNGGTIESEWDAIFVQHLYAGDLDVLVKNGKISGSNSALRVYGNAGSDVDMDIQNGTFTGEIKVADAYADVNPISITGGTFSVDPSAYVADGYKAVKNADDTYGVKLGVIEIWNKEDLIALDKMVEAGDMLEGVIVKLMADIDLYEMGEDGEPVTFNPIGANSYYFKGTFDGQGHTIKNMYQSGWALGYDWYNYGTIGLFAYLWDATVKNLTIENAECFVEGGCVGGIAGSAWGDVTFENITIKNSTFATYNNRAGGIVGYTGGEGTFTFKNILVDEDTVIAGLWGSFDSSLGGVMGQLQSASEAVFEDVTVSCRLDAYNDVTAAYKYYAYRMCGMLIGRIAVDGNNQPVLDNVTIGDNVVIDYSNTPDYSYTTAGGSWQRVEAGYAYDGVDMSQYPDAEVLYKPFNAMFGGQQYGSYGQDDHEKIVAEGRVAKFDGDYYISLQCAANAADGVKDENGEYITVQLVADSDETVYISEFVKLDTNGHKFTGSILAKEEGCTVKYENGVYTVTPAVAKIGETTYETLAEALAAAVTGDTITVLADIALTETVTVPAGKTVTLDLNGKTISGVCNAGQSSLIYIENGAALTVKDNSTEKTGKLTYAAGTSNVGWTVYAEGALTLESGTIELTGEWSIGYAVDVRPNAWGTAYTTPSAFVMNGGKLVSSDGAVRVASSSHEGYKAVSASFTMNGGVIDAAWDGVFIQQSDTAYDVLSFTMTGGTIESDLNPVRVYGPEPTSYVNGQNCMDIKLNGGTLAYTGSETQSWVIDNILRVGGGSSVETILENGDLLVSATIAETAAPEGYKWVEAENGLYTLAAKTYVAQIGETKYETLQEAVNAAQTGETGETVTVLENITLTKTVTVPAGKTVTLDLNGKTVDGIGNVRIALMSYGNLTLMDSSAEQTGVIKAGIGTAGNAVNICGGTFTMESGSIYSKNNAILVDEKAATINILGGKITAEPATKNSAVMYVSSTSDTEINISGGELVGYNGILMWNNTELNMTSGSIEATGSAGIQGNGSKDNTKINISGDASVSGYYTAIYHPQGGELNISGDVTLTGWTGVVVKGGTVNISGGTISGTGAADAYKPVSSGYVDTGDALYVEHYDNSTNSENYGTPVVTVTGGTFTSTNGKAVASYANTDKGVEALTGFISGGTYSNDVPEELCAEGYISVDNGNGTYSVKEGKFVAKIGEKKYENLLDALKAAQEGETVVMLADVELYTRLIFSLYTNGKNVTLDGNGHKLYASSTNWGTGNGKHLINVNCDNVTLKNIVLDSNKIAEGANIYMAQNIVFDNVTIINKTGWNADLTVNGSTLTVKNELSASYVDVSLGKGVTTPLGIVAEEGAVLDVRTLQIASAAYPNTDLDVALSTDGTSYYTYKKLDTNGNLAGYTNSLSRLSNGYGYKVLEDATVSSNVTLLNAGHTGTLDTNGKTLTVADGKTLTVNGNLKVEGTGTITGSIDLGDANATVAAPETLTVTTTVADHGVSYKNGIYMVVSYVAEVNGVKYETLQAAIDAANGETVTVLKDITLTETVTVPAGKTVTLDLAGKIVSMADASGATAALLKNNGTLTIQDTVGNGKLTFNSTTPSTTNAYASNTISNHGTLTVESGIIENTTVGGACYALDNYAGSNATIKGGKLVAEKTTVRVFNWTEGEAAKAVLNVNGGEILSKDGYAINFNMGNAPIAELNITGGTITTNDTDYNLAVYVVNKNSAENMSINVSGGTFGGNFALNGVTSTTMAEGKISVSGGTFDGVICYEEPAYGFVSGGTFNQDPSAYVADGYVAVENNDGKFKVVAANTIYVAQNVQTGEYYETVAEGLSKAASGQTVQMIADSNEQYTSLSIMGGITLDLNGFDLTAKSLAAFNGNRIIDSMDTTTTVTTDIGSLIVPKGNLILPADDEKAELPFWIGDKYIFLSPVIAGNYQYFYAADGDSFEFRFKPSFGYAAGNSVMRNYLTDGAKDNGIKIILKLSWKNADGHIISQLYEYTEEFVKYVYSSTADNPQVFKFNVTGTAGFGEMSINVLAVSDAGVQYAGVTAIYDSANPPAVK